jgi:hypothetical protein
VDLKQIKLVLGPISNRTFKTSEVELYHLYPAPASTSTQNMTGQGFKLLKLVNMLKADQKYITHGKVFCINIRVGTGAGATSCYCSASLISNGENFMISGHLKL